MAKKEAEAPEVIENPIFVEYDSPQDEPVDTRDVTGIAIPGRHEVGWVDYVMSLFQDNEMEGGNPKVNGLRRVTEKIVGRVVGCKSKIVQVPSPDNGQRATVSHTVQIHDANVGMLAFTGSADAAMSNIDDKQFQRYPVAMAETRAEGRAYRRALGLYGICAAEEIDNNPASNADFQPVAPTSEDAIKPTQVSLLNVLCSNDGSRGMNININKFAQKEIGKNMMQASFDECKKLIKVLSSYQGDTSKIPQELLGYEPNWSSV